MKNGISASATLNEDLVLIWYLDYDDIIYDNSSNSTFSQMIEPVQYNAAFAITGAIRGISREKLYQELGFESLHDRRWSRKLFFYYKIRHNMCPFYLTKRLHNTKTHFHSLCSNRPPTVPNFRTERFKSTFPPPALLIGTNLIQIYKILLHLKFLNEPFLFLFVLSQRYTRFTIQKD